MGKSDATKSAPWIRKPGPSTGSMSLVSTVRLNVAVFGLLTVTARICSASIPSNRMRPSSSLFRRILTGRTSGRQADEPVVSGVEPPPAYRVDPGGQVARLRLSPLPSPVRSPQRRGGPPRPIMRPVTSKVFPMSRAGNHPSSSTTDCTLRGCRMRGGVVGPRFHRTRRTVQKRREERREPADFVSGGRRHAPQRSR